MNPDDLFTTSQLLCRDWAKTLIRRFLPDPDGLSPVAHWANYQGTNSYLASRVWAIEQSEEFGAAFVKTWKGRMKKRKPAKVLEELRKTLQSDGQSHSATDTP
jgi:hypothetical protein